MPEELELREAPGALLAAAESALDLGSPRASAYVLALGAELPSATLEILRGRGALSENQIADAIGHFELAKRLSPNLFSSSYWLAMAEYREGLTRQADALLAEIIEREPENLDAVRARVEFARGRSDWESASTSQRKLLAREPNFSAFAYCRLGDSYLHLHKLKDAEEPLRTGLQRDPYSFLCHRDLGELERASGRNSEAQQDLEFVVRFFPEADPKTYASLALVYRAEGKLRTANVLLAKGRRIFPEDTLLQSPELKK